VAIRGAVSFLTALNVKGGKFVPVRVSETRGGDKKEEVQRQETMTNTGEEGVDCGGHANVMFVVVVVVVAKANDKEERKGMLLAVIGGHIALLELPCPRQSHNHSLDCIHCTPLAPTEESGGKRSTDRPTSPQQRVMSHGIHAFLVSYPDETRDYAYSHGGVGTLSPSPSYVHMTGEIEMDVDMRSDIAGAVGAEDDDDDAGASNGGGKGRGGEWRGQETSEGSGVTVKKEEWVEEATRERANARVKRSEGSDAKSAGGRAKKHVAGTVRRSEKERNDMQALCIMDGGKQASFFSLMDFRLLYRYQLPEHAITKLVTVFSFSILLLVLFSFPSLFSLAGRICLIFCLMRWYWSSRLVHTGIVHSINYFQRLVVVLVEGEACW